MSLPAAVSQQASAENVVALDQSSCCIVGGGPGGAMLALLLVRRGVRVTLLEMHKDFDREFRGDTIHPPLWNSSTSWGLQTNFTRFLTLKSLAQPCSLPMGLFAHSISAVSRRVSLTS
jgi:hypothetical protein